MASETQEIFRDALARGCPQPREPRDRVARAIAKALFVVCGLALGAALIWLQQNVNWVFVASH